MPCRKQNFPIIEQTLKESGSGFLFSSGITFADFSLAELLKQWEKIEPTIFDGFSLIKEFKNRVFALPQLKEYLSKH